jgi:hypothetical protein
MPKRKIKTIQTSFVAGEINEALFGRVDKELYFKEPLIFLFNFVYFFIFQKKFL